MIELDLIFLGLIFVCQHPYTALTLPHLVNLGENERDWAIRKPIKNIYKKKQYWDTFCNSVDFTVSLKDITKSAFFSSF